MTRAANFEFLLAGVSDPSTGLPVDGGTAYFYEAGTGFATPKYVYTEKEKTNGFYSYTLDAVGVAKLWGEGIYDVKILASDGSTVYTFYDVRMEHPHYGVTSVSSSPYTQVSSDDLILVDTTSGDITINCLAAADWDRPLKIKYLSGTNDIIVDPNGSETIDGGADLTFRNAVVEIVSDGSNLFSVGFRSAIADSDNDTKIQVEKTTDNDMIIFDTGGSERVVFYDQLNPAVEVNGSIETTGIQDVDGDTKVQVEESSDEDVIRFDVAGSEKATIDSGGLTAIEVDATTFRINGISVVADASDLNQLNGFDLKHTPVIGGLGTGIPILSATTFDVGANISGSWESIGPTGSGATNIWTALNNVPYTYADWVCLYLDWAFAVTGGTPGSSTGGYYSVRDESGNNDHSIKAGKYDVYLNSSGNAKVSGADYFFCNITSGVFEMMGTVSNMTATLYLIGYGQNA